MEAFAATPVNRVARTIQAKPLLIGNWADPSILKDGNDYYMTHSSTEVEVEVEGGATGGLMLFFSPQAYIGLSISEDGVIRRVQKAVQRYGGTQEPKAGRHPVAIRIVNDKQDVRFYYKDDAGAWQILQPSQEVSGVHHNALGGWHAVRPTLFACGQGQAHFRYFHYRPLDN
jgi:beta-xylosidase